MWKVYLASRSFTILSRTVVVVAPAAAMMADVRCALRRDEERIADADAPDGGVSVLVGEGRRYHPPRPRLAARVLPGVDISHPGHEPKQGAADIIVERESHCRCASDGVGGAKKKIGAVLLENVLLSPSLKKKKK